jgi:hypothetical protein
MKLWSILFSSAVALAMLSGTAHAQTTSVIESPVLLTATVLTQGTDTTKQTFYGVTLTTKNIKSTPYTNREVLAEMLKRSLLTGSTTTSGWALVCLKADDGTSGLYAKKAATTPVAVPADLLTLPVFGPSIKGGTSISTTFGASASGTSEIATATASVNGIPVSGLATNGKHVITLPASVGKTIDTVTSAMTFNGGVDGTPSPRLVKGTLAIGSAKVSALTSLP